MTPCLRLGVFVLLAPVAASCAGPGTGATDRTLVVFAAASLRDVAADLGDELEGRHGGEVVFNFAGSNTLAQQIQAAPLADVFLSADGDWVDILDDAGRTVEGSRRPFLSNRLVVVAHRDAPLQVDQLEDLAQTGYRALALADPTAVPAGRYARAYLQLRPWGDGSLWNALQERLIPALDVRAALALAESDPEILAVVHRTDALASPSTRVVYEIPAVPEIEITYWAVLLEGGENPELGRHFLELLASPEGDRIIACHGFVPEAWSLP